MGKSVPVILNVYDMAWTNKYTSTLGIGVFHSGIEVYGVEYGFGGHRYPVSGIFDITPRDTEELGSDFRFRQSVKIGHTVYTLKEVSYIIEELSEEFRGNSYHLMSKNCNHFSNRLSLALCGQSIPRWVNRLAHFSARFPFLERCLPRDWVTPVALNETIHGTDRRVMPSPDSPRQNYSTTYYY